MRLSWLLSRPWPIAFVPQLLGSEVRRALGGLSSAQPVWLWLALASVSVASPSKKSKLQRVVITATTSGDPDHFVLRPVTRGVVAPDSGTTTACCWSQRLAFSVHGDGRTFIGAWSCG